MCCVIVVKKMLINVHDLAFIIFFENNEEVPNLRDVEEGALQLTEVGFQLNGLAHFLSVTFILEKKMMSHV